MREGSASAGAKGERGEEEEEEEELARLLGPFHLLLKLGSLVNQGSRKM